ncbi:hypothetical protein SEA_DIANE_48 [Streptomyces phage Diane]|uniref:Uncharacterized protein n=1 Tax=Streptomyces phage Diane TaxID=2041207 RepID=A0A291LHE9_9CAUD|nr:hypothetical protein KGG78_gp48 [Streptomyces phage Diane]ATI18832.1 hypothetical protein SEA_DIANE_48 [Streptomyces phage Diane]
MTAPSEKPRAGRRGYDGGLPSFLEHLNAISDVCGTCYGHRLIWCPICWGFDGCWTCHHQLKVPCPDCAGGNLLPWSW